MNLLTRLFAQAVCLLFGAVLVAALAAPAHAQGVTGGGEAAAAETARPDLRDLAPDAAARLLADILRDDATREALIAQLLAAASDAGAIAAPPPAAAPSGPDAAGVAPALGVATEPLLQVSAARQIAEYTRALGEQAAAFLNTLLRSGRDVLGVFTGERMVNWIEIETALWAVLLVAAVALGLLFVLRMPGHRFFRYLSGRETSGGEVRGWLVTGVRLGALVVTDAAVILLAWAAGYAVALATGVPGTMDVRQSLFLNAFLLVEMTKVGLRAVLVPGHGRLRFAPMGDETAAYWYFWSSRLVSLLGYGMLLVVPIVNAAVSFTVGRSLSLLIVVAALLTAILIVLQNRSAVRDALKARSRRDPEEVFGRLLALLGGVWHLLAILYLVALFVIWSASPADALHFMLVATAQSVAAVVIGVMSMVVISRAIAAGLRLPADVRRSLPLLEDRLNAFVPTILQVVRVLVALGVVVAIGQAWNVVDLLGWLASEVGIDLVARLLSAALVVLVALGLWLGVSSFVEYRLNPEVGRPPTARERTLLSLFRNAFVVVLLVLATMMTLSQLGVNIAPLLAGAGVVGLAVGFGAQRLVQDVITGAFIQIENAMNEGDVVTVGGTSGVVERLTIRSVGLRDLSGTYHVIPFSSVDSVSNFMKGFAFHVANVGVAYREDVAEVKRLMQVAFDRLCETEHAADIIGPFEMHGVTELGDSAVTVRGRIRTRPGMQWGIGRAYTEIVKQVLDEAGVEIPFPHRTLYLGQDKDGTAPPLRLARAAGQVRAEAVPPPDSAPPDSAPGDDGTAPGASAK